MAIQVAALRVLGGFVSEDLSTLNAAQRAALAADPGTDPAALAELGKDWRLVAEVAANPSTPEETRRAIYADLPHLRPKGSPIGAGATQRRAGSPVAQGPADAVADEAIARFRARSEDQARRRAAEVRIAAGRGRGPSTVVVRDVSGREVRIPAGQAAVRGTNGLAIAALVLGVLGASLLAVAFGHAAKSQIARTGEAGEGMATAGLILGYLETVGLVFVLLLLKWNSG